MNRLLSLRSRAARALGRFLAEDDGATAVEYGLMTALIGLAIMATIISTGEGIKVTLYDAIVNALANMM